MRQLRQAGPDPADEQALYAALSDARLIERIRSGAPAARPAVQELKRRHLPAVLSYARLCARDRAAGHQLAVQAFGLAAQEACRGIEPRGNWRHHVLRLVQRAGAGWALGSRRDRLSPGFAAWADEAADVTAADIVPGLAEAPGLRSEAASAMLTGFYRLPGLTRGMLWYAVVDQERDATVATFLSVRPEHVPELRSKAQDALREAYLRAHLERGSDPRCLGFRRIIEAAARPGDRRRSEDLTLHLTQCPSCTWLMAQLTRMAEDPRTVFAEGLLGWGGAAYAAQGPAGGFLDAVPAQPDRSPATAGMPVFTAFPQPAYTDVTARSGAMSAMGARGARRPSRNLVLIAVVAAGAVAAGTLLATASEDTAPVRDRAQTPLPQQAWPTDALPAPAVPSPSPTAEASKKPSPSPTASRVPKPSVAAPAKSVPRPPAPIAPGAGYTQVVNVASGLCLDIVNGVMANRTDVVTATCSGAETQRWSLDSIGLLHSSADPAYCLDSRGATDRGAGIWSCASVNGKNGLNLLFTVDGAGTIHPRIAPDFALEPLAGSQGSLLGFAPSGGDSDQRWNVGPSPS
ncbi:ricin-type beta-trefoil lectin domain protein [Streptomyces sp. NPDC020681]|uniref:ricin-type beta-trefoil lectin domain protein n=1 Tax=Streptomyces sp. NPDC020681 TaxID=3365083 RepID=UPI0037944114